MYQTIDFLNNAFTYIATAYMYFMAIAILLLFVQSALNKYEAAQSHSAQSRFATMDAAPQQSLPLADLGANAPGERRVVNDEFYQQTKVLLEIEPKESTTSAQGKALVLTVTTEVEADSSASAFPSVKKDSWLDIDFASLNIRAIRAYVRENYLQDLIKDVTGKSVSRCTLKELRGVLIESQQSDRTFSRIFSNL